MGLSLLKSVSDHALQNSTPLPHMRPGLGYLLPSVSVLMTLRMGPETERRRQHAFNFMNPLFRNDIKNDKIL